MTNCVLLLNLTKNLKRKTFFKFREIESNFPTSKYREREMLLKMFSATATAQKMEREKLERALLNIHCKCKFNV